MGIVDMLRKRGAYRGDLRRLIERGDFFQIGEDGRRAAVQGDADPNKATGALPMAQANSEVVA